MVSGDSRSAMLSLGDFLSTSILCRICSACKIEPTVSNRYIYCVYSTVSLLARIDPSSRLFVFVSKHNESTRGADASVEVPKLHNIKLLIASFYTHIDYNYHDEHL